MVTKRPTKEDAEGGVVRGLSVPGGRRDTGVEASTQTTPAPERTTVDAQSDAQTPNAPMATANTPSSTPMTPDMTTEAIPEEAIPAEWGPTKRLMPYDPAVGKALADIFGKPEKATVPTLVTFRVGRVERHVIVAIGQRNMEVAWSWWTTHVDSDAERFLGEVYRVTKHEVPLMYRAVGTVNLIS